MFILTFQSHNSYRGELGSLGKTSRPWVGDCYLLLRLPSKEALTWFSYVSELASKDTLTLWNRQEEKHPPPSTPSVTTEKKLKEDPGKALESHL